jgi:hypothetical protein
MNHCISTGYLQLKIRLDLRERPGTDPRNPHEPCQ